MTRIGDDGRLYIDHFLWTFQMDFRRNFDYHAEQAFKQIGIAVDPRSMLVGFDETAQERHPICVEPEDGPFDSADFEDVMGASAELYALDEDRNSIVTVEGQQALSDSRSLDKVRRKALLNVLNASKREGDRRYFIGSSRVINGYRVFPVLSVLESRWSQIPVLPGFDDRMRIANSFPEELAYRLVESAATSLAVGDHPHALVTAGPEVSSDLVRLSASAFIDSIPYRLDGMPSDLLVHLDAIAATPYEGRPAVGRIRFLSQKSQYLPLLQFGAAVRLSKTRQARKVLEMSDTDHHLVSDGERVVGLAQSDLAPDAFEVWFSGRGVWTLVHGGVDLLRSVNGRATLPAPPLDKSLLLDNYLRLFPEHDESGFESIWVLAQTAAKQEHGTMLVIHRRAEEEARRLGGQAIPLTAGPLSSDALAAATSIDGAVLVSPDGSCHAIGVILDGLAGTAGDAARGARFNSGIRYASSHRGDCLVIVVSEDGSIESVPQPHRRVTRAFIRGVLGDVVAASSGEVDFESFHRLEARAEAHAFYFGESQLDELHAARERVEDFRWKHSSLRVGSTRLLTNEWMDDSYFMSE